MSGEIRRQVGRSDTLKVRVTSDPINNFDVSSIGEDPMSLVNVDHTYVFEREQKTGEK